ncbi:MAG: hypothetical protein ACI9ON_001175 [Limisphaerales bacterium]|jgi:uncharacterized protein YyaL (SSP411 family)
MANQLSNESSPYLQQHAQNPVNWYPWGDEALDIARAEQKPILLSIGYSTCHWCHVMARECFENSQIADVMNQHFINIKVDREERPDLDKVYQTALQLINPQGGGWPLTMFLDPDTLVPFYGGTYFPPEPRYQLPGFSDLLLRLQEAFAEQREEITTQGDKLKTTLGQMTPPVIEPELADQNLLKLAREQLGQQYDHESGGFGRAPKFPMPNTLERVLRHWAYARKQGTTDAPGLDMVMTSLTQMARGGIYDHLGGGFCRYSTDRKWMVPHFEKMLYDNAQLLSLYSNALTLGPDRLFSEAIEQTIDWLCREMRHPGGAFYAAIDADSQGEEGKFYVWRREEVKKLLTEDEYLLVETLYGLDKPANFENKWNLHRHDSWRSVVDRLSLNEEAALLSLSKAKATLVSARAERTRPATDEKILSSWNGLVIRGLADAAVQFDRSEWLALAQQTSDFLRSQCWQDGILYATFQNGVAKQPAYLDDYANVLLGLLSLLKAQWREEDLAFAQDLAQALLTHFFDDDNGGFFFTSHDQEQLIYRPKPTLDDALPPGNGTAVQALLALGHLTGDQQFLDAAHNTLKWARAVMEKVPAAHCSLLHGLETNVYPPEVVILRGPPAEMQTWRAQLNHGFTPWRSIYLIPYEGTRQLPSYLPRLVSSEQQNITTAFVCSNLQCSLPITDLDELRKALT